MEGTRYGGASRSVVRDADGIPQYGELELGHSSGNSRRVLPANSRRHRPSDWAVPA